MSRSKPSRKSNRFHARNVNPAPSAPPVVAPTPPPASPETPHPKPQAARDTAPRYNALRHGAYAASLDATAAALGEDPAEVAALLAEVWDSYAPQDAQEERVVQRLAATWRRLNRLSAHAQGYLRDRLAGGALPLFALKESEAASGEEAKLERALLRLHRHLEFLQRWRVAAAQRRAAQASRDAQAEIEAMLALSHAEAVRHGAEARERLFPPPADDTTIVREAEGDEGADALPTTGPVPIAPEEPAFPRDFTSSEDSALSSAA